MLVEKISRKFIEHPKDEGLSYLQHNRMALRYARSCFMAGVKASVHAILPFLYTNGASEIVSDLHNNHETKSIDNREN